MASGAVSPAASASDAATGLRPVDKSALASLVASGGNRACGHDIESEIKVPTLADGNAISDALQSNAYFVRVAQNAQGDGALVIVEQHLVPTDTAIVSMVAAMQRIAKAHHGTFDRWETTPVKTC